MSQKVNRRKDAKIKRRSKTDNDSTEVFVLPPNILEKLGINLGNVKNVGDCPINIEMHEESGTIKNGMSGSENNYSEFTCETKINENNKEDSMLETANLMKKSVFLSPTFVPTVLNSLPNEIELANNLIELTVPNDSQSELKNSPVTKSYNVFSANGCISALDKTNSKENNNLFHQHLEPNSIAEDLLDENLINQKCQEPIINFRYLQGPSPEDHPIDSLSKKSDFLPINTNSQKKVNIISLEIPNISESKGVKRFVSLNKQALIPVTRDTVISGKKTHLDSVDILPETKFEVSQSSKVSDFKLPVISNLNLSSEVIDNNNENAMVNNLYVTFMPLTINEEDNGTQTFNDENTISQIRHKNLDTPGICNKPVDESLNKCENYVEPLQHITEFIKENLNENIDREISEMDLLNLSILNDTEKDFSDKSDAITAEDAKNPSLKDTSKDMFSKELGTDIPNEIYDAENCDAPHIYNTINDKSYDVKNKIIEETSSMKVLQTQHNMVLPDMATHIHNNVMSTTDIYVNGNENVLLNTNTAESKNGEYSVNLNEIFGNQNSLRVDKTGTILKNENDPMINTESNINENLSLLNAENNSMNTTETFINQNEISLPGETETTIVLDNENLTDEHLNQNNRSLECAEKGTVLKNAVDSMNTIDTFVTQKVISLPDVNSLSDINVTDSIPIVIHMRDDYIDTAKPKYIKMQSNIINSDSKFDESLGDKNKEDYYGKEVSATTNSGKFCSNGSVCELDAIKSGNEKKDIVAEKTSKINIDLIQDKIQEIASYLKCISSNAEQNRLKPSKKRKLIPHGGPVKSKLCIQGVEKPGGSNQDKYYIDKSKIQKVYKKSLPKRHSYNDATSAFQKLSQNEIEFKNIRGLELNTTEINVMTDFTDTTRFQEFCICGDFGKMTYYDTDSFYEHIHFWWRKITNYNIETILDIYNDAHIVEWQENDKIPNEQSHNICWHSCEFKVDESLDAMPIQNEFCQDTSKNLETSTDDKDISTTDKDTSSTNNCVSDFTKNKIHNPADMKILDTAGYTNSDKNIAHILRKTFENSTNDKITEISKNLDAYVESMSDSIENTSVLSSELQEYSKTAEHNSCQDNSLEDNASEFTVEQSTNKIVSISTSKVQAPNKTIIDVEDTYRLSVESIPEINKASLEISVALELDVKQLEERENSMNKYLTDNTDTPKCSKTLNKNPPTEYETERSKNKHKLNKTRVSGSIKVNEVTCGVCKKALVETEWEKHISKEHCYIAWKDGDSLDFDGPDLYMKLGKLLKKSGSVKCTFCNRQFKYPKVFLSHVQRCQEIEPPSESDTLQTEDCSTCGVCKKSIKSNDWIKHISREHNYLAWKDGETPLDTNNRNEVINHLLNIAQNNTGLICVKCGVFHNCNRRSVKSFLEHINTCDKIQKNNINQDNTENKSLIKDLDGDSCVCAVCKKNIEVSKWYKHIYKNHNYLAWKDGENPLDLKNEESVSQHLYYISKEIGGLKCNKCGLLRKYVKSYLQHIKFCKNTDISDKSTIDKDKVTDIIEIKNKKKELKCAVCGSMVKETVWYDHIGSEHNYIAWEDGETPVNSDDMLQLLQHLHRIVKEIEKLVCSKCGIARKYPKSYWQHVQKCCGPILSTDASEVANESMDCTITSEFNNTSELNSTLDGPPVTVDCGVCKQKIVSDQWIDHIQTSHYCLAWKEGEPPLDFNDEEAIWQYLYNFGRETELVCSKCGIIRKYPKSYLHHIKECDLKLSDALQCDAQVRNSRVHDALSDAQSRNEQGGNEFEVDKIVKCGVCSAEVRLDRWMNHIQVVHNYLAWKVDQTPVDEQNPKAVRKYLSLILKKIETFVCSKCGTAINDVEAYLGHMESCKGDPNYKPEVIDDNNKDLYRCAICSEYMRITEWKAHAMDKHYNLAWIVGDEPIDLKTPVGTMKYLQEYLDIHGSLVCKVCGISRVSLMGFYAHIITCGKTDEETEIYKDFCDICQNKYLCIYKSQHMAAHIQQRFALERKIKYEECKVKENERSLDESLPVSGRRRAAEKAKTVIEKYNKSLSESQHKCPFCAFGTNNAKEMSEHKCDDSGESDVESSKLEESETDDDVTDGEKVEADSSEDEVERARKKKRSGETTAWAKIRRLPFHIEDAKEYIRNGFKQFKNIYYMSDALFPNWRNFEYTVIADDEVSKYLPPLEESCRVYMGEEWMTCKRFQSIEGKKNRTLFVGACIQSISWVPTSDQKDSNYLTVVGHAGGDIPRFAIDELPQHAALIQIWHCGLFDKNPEFVFGLAHDYGTVWSIDWCPSGARDPLPVENVCAKEVRLGLLAVACSNGRAYIFSVPNPSTLSERGKLFYKLRPVVELRCSSSSFRKMYQASSICWSKQIGHATIIVGYADGSIAYYDLNTESPLLRTEENGVTILYPFYDEKPQSTCVTGVSTYPVGSESEAVSAASPTGASLVSRACVPSMSRLRSNVACSSTLITPGWPSVMLSGHDAILNSCPNELDFWGCGRRVGLMLSCCGYERCGRIVAYMPPFLRLMDTHGAYKEVNKKVLAVLRMKKIGRKRKYAKDELGVELEPTDYKGAVLKYGIEIKVGKSTKAEYQRAISQQREVCTDRFPLSDVPSMAFCSSSCFQNKLAVATHAGLIFLIDV